MSGADTQNRFELSLHIQQNILIKYLIAQTLCCVAGTGTNLILHGLTPVLAINLLTTLLEFLIAVIALRKKHPFIGAWIINLINGLFSFPYIVFFAGMPSSIYPIIVIVTTLYISSPRLRIFNVSLCTGLYVLYFLAIRNISPRWVHYTDGEFGSFLTSFLLVTVSVLLLATVFLRQYREFSDALRMQSEAKSHFLARMSHEIRTPLNGVIGMNEMIIRECDDKNIIKYASNARMSGKILLGIVNDILDISKIESGKMEIVEVEYCLKNTVAELVATTASRARQKGLKFIWNVDPALPSKLCGDDMKLVQVCTNLLSNAIKYTDSGSVSLTINGTPGDDRVLLNISVSDTGRGISEESQAYLFDAFSRFDLKHTRHIEGTGLGLNIASKYVSLLGGELRVKSAPGSGSEFYFAIEQKIADRTPVGELNADNIEITADKSDDLCFTAPEASVLVVDDNTMNLVVFSNYLKKTQISVTRSTSGEDCLDKIKKQKYDIIFLDHMMPKMDGMEVLRNMKEPDFVHLNKNAPVVALTANAVSGAKEFYMENGFDDFITKPVSLSQLDGILRKYLPPDYIISEKTPTSWQNAGGK